MTNPDPIAILRAHREEYGLRGLALKIGIYPSHLKKIIDGEVAPAEKTLTYLKMRRIDNPPVYEYLKRK